MSNGKTHANGRLHFCQKKESKRIIAAYIDLQTHIMKSAKTRHTVSNSRKEWIISGALCLSFFILFIFYYEVRNKPFSLFTTEKATAIASLCCISTALSLGPISRFFPSFFKLLPYRRPLGIIAAIMSIPHVLLALIYLPLAKSSKYSADFPMSWFVDHWLTTVAGFLCFALLLTIAIYSYPSKVRQLGKRKWMILQKLGYLVLIFIAIHLLSMGKIPKNWIAWLDTRNYPLPPGSFPQMVICLIPLILKGIDLFVHGDSLVTKKK